MINATRTTCENRRLSRSISHPWPLHHLARFPFGGLPVASDSPVDFWQIAAARPFGIVFFRSV
jgi:hypothetical protein